MRIGIKLNFDDVFLRQEARHREHIYLEGGPLWKNDCVGRGDLYLLYPVSSVIIHPDGGGACEYVRTSWKRKSSLYNTWLTVFRFKRRIWEAAGWIASMRAGIDPSTVRRPIEHTHLR